LVLTPNHPRSAPLIAGLASPTPHYRPPAHALHYTTTSPVLIHYTLPVLPSSSPLPPPVRRPRWHRHQAARAWLHPTVGTPPTASSQTLTVTGSNLALRRYGAGQVDWLVGCAKSCVNKVEESLSVDRSFRALVLIMNQEHCRIAGVHILTIPCFDGTSVSQQRLLESKRLCW
jgi:hypothetical protein